MDVRRLKSMAYDEYLATDHWQGIRLAALAASERRCGFCNRTVDDFFELDVHHLEGGYAKRGEEVVGEDVIAICRSCHRKRHPDWNDKRRPSRVRWLPEADGETAEIAEVGRKQEWFAEYMAEWPDNWVGGSEHADDE